MSGDPKNEPPKVQVQTARTTFPKERRDGDVLWVGALFAPALAVASGSCAMVLLDEDWWVLGTVGFFVAVSVGCLVLGYRILAAGLYLGLVIFLGLVTLVIFGLCGRGPF